MTTNSVIFEADQLTCSFPESGFIPGYMIIFLKADITSVDQLDQAARLSLIDTIALLQAAIKEVINPERIYTLSIGEIQPRLHFHIFPRTKQLLADYQLKLALEKDQPVSGMHLFEWARQEYHATPLDDNYDTLNNEISLYLQRYI